MHIVQSYHNGFSGGIGDFLRGSVYLHKICKENGIKLSLDWSNHTIGKYIKNERPLKEYSLDYVLDIEELAIKNQTKLSWNEKVSNTLNTIIKEIVQNNYKDPIIVSSFYIKIYNNASTIQQFKDYVIPDETKKLIQNNMVMCDSVKEKHKSILSSQNYGTIHFRLGDRKTLPNIKNQYNSLPNDIKNNYNLSEFNYDYDYLYSLITNTLHRHSFDKLVLLSDCNSFKKYISEKNNNKILIPHYNSVHSAVSPGLLKYSDYKHDHTDHQIENTALDLQILTNSKKNISYSCYIWGSGFSIWPSKIFDIPLEAYQLQDTK